MTPDEVDRVAAIADPVIRNLRITQAYHELSATTAARLGPVANWCTYATWASKQAGRTIREEDLGRALEAALGSSPAAAAAAHDVAEPRSVDSGRDVAPDAPLGVRLGGRRSGERRSERASDAVARGNRKVFEEIGREFARFEVECGPDAAARRGRPRRVPGAAPTGRAAGRAGAPAPRVLVLPPGPLRGRPGHARAARAPRQPRDRRPRADAPPAGDRGGARRGRRGSARRPGSGGRGPVPAWRLARPAASPGRPAARATGVAGRRDRRARRRGAAPRPGRR